MNKQKEKEIIDFILGLSERPCYVDEKIFSIELKKDLDEDYLEIIMFGSYYIRLYSKNDCFDVAYCHSGGYSKQDLEYDAQIIENKDEIFRILNN